MTDEGIYCQDARARRERILARDQPLQSSLGGFVCRRFAFYPVLGLAAWFGAVSLRAEIPEVATFRLKEALAGELTPEERVSAVRDLAEAQLASGEPEAALKALGESRDGLLRARILMRLGRWEQALSSLRDAEAAPAAVALAEAECLRHLGRMSEAIKSLRRAARSEGSTPAVRLLLAELLLDSGELNGAVSVLRELDSGSGFEAKWLAYLRGRAALAGGRSEEAREFFGEAVADTTKVSPEVAVGATVGIARANVLLGSPEDGAAVLEEFLWKHPGNPRLSEVFEALDALYDRQTRPSSEQLLKLSQEPPARRAALAAYYLARARVREGAPAQALAVLEEFTGRQLDEPIMAKALAMQARLLMEHGKPAEDALRRAMPLAKTPRELGRLEMLVGASQFRQGDYVQAAISFHNAADHDPGLAERATFNAALAWLFQGNYERFLEEYARISAEFPEGALRQELILEQGLVQARKRDSRARETLELFLRDFPENPRVAEVRVVLAELAYANGPAGKERAQEYLRVANEGPIDPESAAQTDYLAIYLEDANDRGIEAAKHFLAKYPDSPLRPKVRMKLGELYSASGDLANARTQFETLAADLPDSPYTDAALYLAGKAAAKMMDPDRALELFEAVVNRQGTLALYARAEQAAVKTRLGEEGEAIILYDSILGGNPPDDLRYAAMMGKGDCQFLLGSSDPKQYEAAVATFHTLSGLEGIPAHWRNQALYKQGKGLEKLGRPDAALVAFTEVLNDGEGDPDPTWVFRAGFDAARILESREHWKSAATLYRQMAEIGGARSEEARKRLTQLRLEHFLWE